MSVNIAELVENNPITRFSGDYKSKLISRIVNEFQSNEQQLFLSSFYCYMNYDSKTDFVIDLDNIWHWLGFNQKYNAKVLLEKSFKIDIDYKIFSETNVNHVRGGHNKEKIMMNIYTFKKFCLKASTKKADEIQSYFTNLELIILSLLKEDNDEKLMIQMKKIEQEKEEQIKLFKETETEKIKQEEKEKLLLTQFTNAQSIVYIIKVKTFENGNYIIKIGESRRGISGRYTEHKTNYDECLLLDCFSVNRSKDFENFLHNHEKIRKCRVKNLQNHENENELFLIGNHLAYSHLIKIINDNIQNYQFTNEHYQEQEIEKLKLLASLENNTNPLITEMYGLLKTVISRLDTLESQNKELLQKLAIKPSVTGFNQPLPSLGPRLQKINPETLQLIETYESVSEAMKIYPEIKRPTINKAIVENTVYCGYRWLFVDRDSDPTIIKSISPTVDSAIYTQGYIAKVNATGDEIINVYIDRTTAALKNGYGASGLDNACKKNVLSRGFYYRLYNSCDESLKQAFENKIGCKPLLYKNGVGKYDMQNNLVHTYDCKFSCLKQEKMSDKTLTKALNSGNYYKDYKYVLIGEKISI